eukprot:m.346626 g.346626  ORF g.346626 m.346626 type:complete len:220 (-) comp29650_c0_seq1:119-778(-)
MSTKTLDIGDVVHVFKNMGDNLPGCMIAQAFSIAERAKPQLAGRLREYLLLCLALFQKKIRDREPEQASIEFVKFQGAMSWKDVSKAYSHLGDIIRGDGGPPFRRSKPSPSSLATQKSALTLLKAVDAVMLEVVRELNQIQELQKDAEMVEPATKYNSFFQVFISSLRASKQHSIPLALFGGVFNDVGQLLDKVASQVGFMQPKLEHATTTDGATVEEP